MSHASSNTAGRARPRATMTASLATVAALVMGAVVAVAAPAGAQASTNPPKSARDLPVLRSDPAPKVAPEALVGDFTNAPPHPSQADPAGAPAKPSAYDRDRSVTVDSETTPTKKVVANRDGSRTSVLSAGPVRFQDASGWHDIDLTVVPGPGATLVAKAAPGAARLAARADGVVATIDTPAGPIGLRHPQSSPAPATVEAARATYKGALGGRDLVLDLRPDGFEETVVLPDAKAAGTYRDEFVLPAGVTARDAPVGVEFLDAKGTVLATVSHGIAFDSAPVAAAAPVTVHIVPNAPSPATPQPTAPAVAPSAPATTTPGPRAPPPPPPDRSRRPPLPPPPHLPPHLPQRLPRPSPSHPGRRRTWSAWRSASSRRGWPTRPGSIRWPSIPPWPPTPPTPPATAPTPCCGPAPPPPTTTPTASCSPAPCRGTPPSPSSSSTTWVWPRGPRTWSPRAT